MAQLAVSETTTFRWSFEEDVTRYAAAGIPAIGVWRHKLSDCGAPRSEELLQRAGLSVAYLSWAGGFTGADGRSYRESLEDAVEAVRTAASLRCPTLVVYSGSRAGHTANHARRLFRAAMLELAPVADDLGVTLAVEPMHPGCAAEWTFLTSLAEVVEFLDAVGHPRVQMAFDTYHLGQGDISPESIMRAAPRVALVRLGDARRPPVGEQNRCRLGEGHVPLDPILAALQAGGYDGYYDVELLGEEIESVDYPLLLEHAREAFHRYVLR